MNRKLTIAILITTVALGSCYYDVEEELYGVCNTGTVTYSSTINGIISNYGCRTCHGSSNPSGGFSLVTYDNVKAKVNDGRLIGAINHMAGFAPMPQGAQKMTQCDINKVQAWIDAGAPNN